MDTLGHIGDLEQIFPFATVSLQPEGEEDTRGNERHGLGKSLCVRIQCSLEAGNFTAVLTGGHHWKCCCDLIRIFEKGDATIFEPQLIYQ